jgi:flagellin
LGIGNANGAKSMEKLSSGFRINRAGDDAAGLSISEKMRAQIRGLNQASRNSQDGISLIQTAEGALQETHAILQRMRELVVQAGNGTNNEDDLQAIQNEIDALVQEMGGQSGTGGVGTPGEPTTTPATATATYSGNQESAPTLILDASEFTGTEDTTFTLEWDGSNWTIASAEQSVVEGKITYQGIEITVPGMTEAGSFTVVVTAASTSEPGESPVADATGSKGISDRTEFNGKALLDGTLDITLQIGSNGGQQVNFSIEDMSATGLGVDGIDVTDFATTDFDTQLASIDQAIKDVSSERSKLGAMQNRLEHTIKNVDNAAENLQAAESRIRDVDMAKEMMEFTKNNILQQAAQAMLAQANQAPQGVLQLLR